MVIFEEKYVFIFRKLTISWRKDRSFLLIEFCTYQQNPKLFAVETVVISKGNLNMAE